MTENQTSDVESPFDPQAILVDLNTEKNRLAPISKIPPEILADIFVMTSRLVRDLDWIKLTYVCHDWRSLALDSPILWTDLPFRNTHWCKEMLLRSKEATLRIEFYLTNDQFSNFLEIVKNHMFRIGSIMIRSDSCVTPRLLECLPESAPRLESLVMSPVSSHRSDEAMKLLKNSLCNVPRMRQMELEYIGIDWEKHLSSSITSLRLRQTPHTSLPTLVQVWDALERMPQLEILELLNALPIPETPDVSNRAISLGNLRELKLDSGTAQIKSFLSTITFPSTACVEIGCRKTIAKDYNDLDAIFVLLGRWLTEGRSAQIESLKIEIYHDIQVGFFTSDSDQGPQKCPSLEFSVFFGREDYAAAELMLTNIFQSFTGSFVNELTVDSGREPLSSSTILNTFGSLPQLRTMTIRVESPILDALRSKLPFAGNSGQSRVSFPSLQSLIMDETWFIKDHDDSEDQSHAITVESLRDCLAWREKQGARLKVLEAKECICIEEGDCDPLRDVVDEFKWTPRQWFICG